MENKVYNIQEIMSVLPHRYPFLLVDKIEVIEAGVKGVGYKNVTVNEPFFQGHFPSNPIMPGVLQIEAMAQTAAFVIASRDESLAQASVLFMGVDQAKFRRPVVPGDCLKMCVEKIKQHRNVFVCETKTYVGEEIVCQALLTALVN